MKRILLFLQFILVLLPALVQAQTITVRGTVRDADGPLPGATIIEKGVTGNGTVSTADGKYRLTLRGTSRTVIVRFVGYIQQEVKVPASGNADVLLATNSHGLDEVSVIGYGKTTRITNTGAVSSIQASDIRDIPTANVQNALTGKLPGFFSQQSSGQPGRDASDFFIRGVSSLNSNGNQPLIIVDDVEYTYDQLQQINVNEIESISILKDASTTAIYGIKGANGVLVVTTRRGKAGKPQINFRVESGVQTPTRTPKFLDSYQSAQLINEAYANDGLAAPFTQNDLNLFQNGSDPYGHPNVNWYDKIFNKVAYQANTNLDISGGTDQLKYFVSGGALYQNGLVKNFPDPRGQVNNNYYFSRYNFRSNLDLKANKTLDLRLDVSTRFSDLNQPEAEGAVGEIYDFTKETPFSAPFLNPNGSFAYNYSRFNPGRLPTLNARLASDGYSNSRRTDYNVLFNAVQKLDAITPGLSVTGRVAYASVEQYTKSIVNTGSIPSYHYDPTNTAQPYTLNPNGSYVFSNYAATGNTDIYTTNVNVQLFSNYDRTFNNAHHITGLLLFNQQSATTFATTGLFDPTQVGVPGKFRGISLRAGYDYKNKYLFDINTAYNGTDRFAAGHRFGVFPAVSVGYNLSREKFFNDLFPVFGLFKLRGSFGLVGSDIAPNQRYIYNQYYVQGNGYNFGESAQGYNTYYEGALGNNSVGWEKKRSTDIGLDLNMLKNNALSLTFDYFYDYRYDQLIQPGNVPQILGVTLPAINLGVTQNTGFDGQIGYHSSVGKFLYNANFVFSYAKNKILYTAEATSIPYQQAAGYPIGQPIGYQFVGYYTAADVAAITAYEATHGNSNLGNTTVAAPETGVPHAGDLKYKDLNGDGIISVFDKTHIGHPNLPNTTLGLTLGGQYKGFSVSVLLQGAFNYSFIVTGTGIEPFESQFQPIDLQRWTPATAATAQFPRLSTNPTTINSPTFYPSDYWLLNAYYIRLKTLELRYQIPTKLLPFHLNGASVYLTAYNLITWDNYHKYQQDPEITTNTAGDAYINQRVVNLGVQISL